MIGPIRRFSFSRWWWGWSHTFRKASYWADDDGDDDDDVGNDDGGGKPFARLLYQHLIEQVQQLGRDVRVFRYLDACTMAIAYLQSTRWRDISKVVHEWFSEDRIPLTFVCESCYTKRGCSHLQKVSCKSKVKRRFHHSSFFQENLFGIIWFLNMRGEGYISKFYEINATMYEKLSWTWSSCWFDVSFVFSVLVVL